MAYILIELYLFLVTQSTHILIIFIKQIKKILSSFCLGFLDDDIF